MTYGLTASSKIASEKQVNLIVNLSKERTDQGLTGDVIETIMNAIEGKIVTSAEARTTIDSLFKQPKINAVKAATAAGGVLAGIPVSKYAITVDGKLVLCEVRQYKGTIYMNQLFGAPGDWRRVKAYGARRAQFVAAIKAAGPFEAAQAFGAIFTVCGCCGSPLSNEVSIAEAMGPVCRAKF